MSIHRIKNYLVALICAFCVSPAYCDTGGFPSRPTFQEVGIRTPSTAQTLPTGESGWIRAIGGLSIGDNDNTTSTAFGAVPGTIYVTEKTNNGTQLLFNHLPADPTFAYELIGFAGKNGAGTNSIWSAIQYGMITATAGNESVFANMYATSNGIQRQVWDWDPRRSQPFMTDGTIWQKGVIGTSNLFASASTFSGAMTVNNTITSNNTISGAAHVVPSSGTNSLPLDIEGTVTTGITARIKNNSVNTGASAVLQVLNINNNGAVITANNLATDGVNYNCSNTGSSTCTFTQNSNQFLAHLNSPRSTTVGDSGGATDLVGSTVTVNGSTLITTNSFTATFTGMTSATTGTVFYRIVGNVAYLYSQTSITGTSNSTSMTMTGLPAAIQPAHEHVIMSYFTDSGTLKMGLWDVTNSGTVTLSICATTVSCSATGFTNSGSKGVQIGWTVSYQLD